MTNNKKFTHEYSSECVLSSISDIRDKKITIMGLGLNGGGEASARFFSQHGAYLTITDMKTEAQLRNSINSLKNDSSLPQDRIRYVLGKHELDDFKNADLVIKNPGVKFEGNKYLQVAKNIETDLSIFLRFSTAPIIAVTGSKGKSSTVSAIYYGLKEAGFTTFLGGNITVSPLTFIDQTTSKTPVILELSSWQLSDLRGRKILKPIISLITKIVPDHQNWYGNMSSYVADKKLIYADQDTKDITICAYDDPWGNTFASETKGFVIRYGKEPSNTDNYLGVWLDSQGKGWSSVPKFSFLHDTLDNLGTELESKNECILSDLIVPGVHMRENVLNAALIMSLLGVKSQRIRSIMAGFPGITHRLEYFHTWHPQSNQTQSVRFYNDSTATVPEAVEAALLSFDKPVHLICGGTDKLLNFLPLVHSIKLAKSAFLIAGTGTDKLIPLLVKKGILFYGPFSSLKELLLELKKNLRNNTIECEEVVVLSPGAASFGMFTNEFDRGNIFKKNVLEIFT